MKRRIVWLVLSCLMVVALVLASCAPAAPPAEKPAAPAAEKPTAPAAEKPTAPAAEKPTAPAVEEPKYGGKVTLCTLNPFGVWDDAIQPPWINLGIHFTGDNLLQGDWTRGLAGTSEADWTFMGGIDFITYFTGAIAEKYEVVNPETVVFHIRRGVHFALDPKNEASRLVKGRELTAQDVAFCLNRVFSSRFSYVGVNVPLGDPRGPQSITATDKYTVVMKVLPGRAGEITRFTGYVKYWPPELVAKYGDMKDWRVNVGTGAFMVENHVEGSSSTFVRNPNYWETDPVGPGKGHQLPYLDGVKVLIIPDVSTRLAAMRTAKIDVLQDVNWEDAGTLVRSNPDLGKREILSSTYYLAMRVDKPELPFKDIRVRQALSMAIDSKTIISSLYGGKGEVLVMPVSAIKEYSDAYIPLDQLPPAIRGVYEYQPDKARQLLAEAGYPNGFKTSVVCSSINVEWLSVVKDYWAKIGVDLAIDVKEYGVAQSMGGAKTYQECYVGSLSTGMSFALPPFESGSLWNHSRINDPRVDAARNAMIESFFDQPRRVQLLRDITPYILEQCWYILRPSPYNYNLWQPWVKNYHGENHLGINVQFYWAKYLWVDEELKASLTGRK